MEVERKTMRLVTEGLRSTEPNQPREHRGPLKEDKDETAT